MKREEKIKTIMDKLRLSREDAVELLEFDESIDKAGMKELVPGEVEVPKVRKGAKKGITGEELAQMKEMLTLQFPNGMQFKNKDLSALQTELNLTARQTPSRLKKLVEEGFLEDLGGSPKAYKVK